MESKELPEDVLAVIREYSKPVFVHFREYNQAMGLFDLSLYYKEKLKKKIEDPAVREQIKICVEAEADYHQKNATYQASKTSIHENAKDKSHWWAHVSRDKFVALLDEREYRMQGFAEWYFQEDIDDAWMDSDDESDDQTDEEALEAQEYYANNSDSEESDYDNDS